MSLLWKGDDMSKDLENEKKDNRTEFTQQGYGTCGVQHDDCPSSWKGTCDRSSPHDGAHHCSACNSHF